MTPPPIPASVASAFDAAEPGARDGLLALRALIYEVAADLPRIGQIQETLRWGQPAYLTPETRSGSTLRLGVPKSARFALFVHCRTRLIEDFITLFPDQDRIEGSRAVLFDDPARISRLRHGWLIQRALTYRL